MWVFIARLRGEPGARSAICLSVRGFGFLTQVPLAQRLTLLMSLTLTEECRLAGGGLQTSVSGIYVLKNNPTSLGPAFSKLPRSYSPRPVGGEERQGGREHLSPSLWLLSYAL